MPVPPNTPFVPPPDSQPPTNEPSDEVEQDDDDDDSVDLDDGTSGPLISPRRDPLVIMLTKGKNREYPKQLDEAKTNM
jgi:hypothetical protein